MTAPRKYYFASSQKGCIFALVMKKLLIILSFVLCVATAGHAQEIRNTSNAVVAKIESDGTVRDKSNFMVARINDKGEVRDASNRYLGKIEADGTVRDKSNFSIGKIESNGTVRARNNFALGKVDSDGAVRDTSNRIIGYAKGVPMRYAALFFFFGLLM